MIITSDIFEFQYRKRYEVTCDSVSGRPQKQKARKVVLENLLESERLREFFDSHYILIEYVMTSPRLIFQGLWRFEENRKTYPVFAPPRGFPFFILYHGFFPLSNEMYVWYVQSFLGEKFSPLKALPLRQNHFSSAILCIMLHASKKLLPYQQQEPRLYAAMQAPVGASSSVPTRHAFASHAAHSGAMSSRRFSDASVTARSSSRNALAQGITDKFSHPSSRICAVLSSSTNSR